MNISNCSRVRTSHPPGSHYRGPIYICTYIIKREKNFIREFLIRAKITVSLPDYKLHLMRGRVIVEDEEKEEEECYLYDYRGSGLNTRG